MKRKIYLKLALISTLMLLFTACGSDSNRVLQEFSDTVDGDDSGYIEPNKKIFLIGDSTVNNPTDIGMGWGDQIGNYMVNPDNLYNLAQSGSSSKSYKEPDDYYNNWPKTKRFIESTDIDNGGYLLIQFGHNDESYDEDIKTYAGVGNSFYNELREYVVYAQSVSLTPVLITPVERMEKVDGYLHYTHDGYAQTVRDLAQKEGVLLLDLQDKSWNKFNEYKDTEELVSIFGYEDNTHFNSYGADVIASLLKELICSSDNQTLCKQFK